MLAQGWLRDAEHARNVRFGNAVGGHRLGLPPLRVSRGPDRSSQGLACPLRGDVVEASTVAVEHRLLAGEVLPALHRNIEQQVAALSPVIIWNERAGRWNASTEYRPRSINRSPCLTARLHAAPIGGARFAARRSWIRCRFLVGLES
jgi:hypothetical protein